MSVSSYESSLILAAIAVQNSTLAFRVAVDERPLVLAAVRKLNVAIGIYEELGRLRPQVVLLLFTEGILLR